MLVDALSSAPQKQNAHELGQKIMMWVFLALAKQWKKTIKGTVDWGPHFRLKWNPWKLAIVDTMPASNEMPRIPTFLSSCLQISEVLTWELATSEQHARSEGEQNLTGSKLSSQGTEWDRGHGYPWTRKDLEVCSDLVAVPQELIATMFSLTNLSLGRKSVKEAPKTLQQATPWAEMQTPGSQLLRSQLCF